MGSEKTLKLVLKCVDKEEYGNLYALNKKITESEKELVQTYFKKYQPIDFKNIMNVEGNPYGWMCKEENAQKVEELLNITETLEKQKETHRQRQKELVAKRRIKDRAMQEIEQKFKHAQRPTKFLKKLLKKADIVYDPEDSFLTDYDYGEGQLFLIDSSYIWYIINNGRKGDDYSLNNIKTGGPGAVGFRIAYDEQVHNLIKIVSDENEYKGK